MEIKDNYNDKIDMTRNDNVSDRVFCLSKREVMTYFPDSYSRIAKVTSHAKARVKKSARKYFIDKTLGTGCYWLRTRENGKIKYVDFYGTLDLTFTFDYSGVRPALWINLEAFDKLKNI